MQVGVPDLLHLDRRGRGRRNHDVVIRSVVASIGLCGCAHRIQKNGELPSQIARRRHLQINLGVEGHLRQRSMIDVDQFSITGAMSFPDSVQSELFVKRPHQRHKVGDHFGIGRQFHCFNLKRKSRGRVEVERQRYIVRKVMRGVRSLVLPVEQAHGTDDVLSPGRIRNRAANFRPDLRPQRIGCAQLLVVSAGVDGGQHGEQRLAGLKGHLRSILSSSRRQSQHYCQGDSERESNHLFQEDPSDPRHIFKDELEVVYELVNLRSNRGQTRSNRNARNAPVLHEGRRGRRRLCRI